MNFGALLFVKKRFFELCRDTPFVERVSSILKGSILSVNPRVSLWLFFKHAELYAVRTKGSILSVKTLKKGSILLDNLH